MEPARNRGESSLKNLQELHDKAVEPVRGQRPIGFLVERLGDLPRQLVHRHLHPWLFFVGLWSYRDTDIFGTTHRPFRYLTAGWDSPVLDCHHGPLST